MRFLLLLIVAVLMPGSAAMACDTPVYRYAMYRWQPAPYQVFCFHHGKLTTQDQEIQQAFRTAATSKPATANVAFTPVDIAADPGLENSPLPEMVRQIWRSGGRPAESSYLIMSPIGLPVYQGPLKPADVPPLLTSPLRNKIAAELSQGIAGVLLLVKGKDTPVYDEPPEPGSMSAVNNSLALKRLKQLAEDIQSGAITPPTERPPGATGYLEKEGASESFDPLPGVDESPQQQKQPEQPDGAKPQTPGLRITVLELDRDDPREAWLLRMLMAVEPDLLEFDEPMVFAFLGRGRVLPPYIGRGIHPRLLEAQFEFMTGPCSCTVAEENPGVDILMTQNWDAAAKKMADLFGSEEGNETSGAGEEFFPELLTGGDVSSGQETPAEEIALHTAPESDSSNHNLKPAATTLTHGTSRSADSYSYSTGITYTPDYSWSFLLATTLGALVLLGVVVMGVVTFATRKSQ